MKKKDDNIKKGNVIKNYIYNLLYEVFLLIVPIAVTPYVARALGEGASGQYSYTFSISTYFTLFAALGFNVYAQRIIASHQGDKKQQTVCFWEIFFARLVPNIITLVIYYIMIFLNIYGEKYLTLVSVLSINVIAVAFDISFFFQGNEEFGKIVIRNIIIKSISIVCIFVFVKDSSDIVIYTIIQSATILLSNISLWLYLPTYFEKISFVELHPLKHIRPTLVLFLPTIATSIYTSLDKTLIGVITKSDVENGNYEYAEKLVKMTLTILTSLGTVMSPKNTKKFADGDFHGVEQNIYNTTRYVLFLGVPLMFGIISVADNLIPWYLGSGYEKAAHLMKILSPIIVIIGLSNVFGRQYLIPSNQDKKFTIAIISGALTNLILNIILINLFSSYGAACATVIAELVVTLVMLYYVHNDFKIAYMIKLSWRYFVAGLIMFVPCYFLGQYLEPAIVNTAIIAFAGASLYFVMVIFLKDKFVFELLYRINPHDKNL